MDAAIIDDKTAEISAECERKMLDEMSKTREETLRLEEHRGGLVCPRRLVDDAHTEFAYEARLEVQEASSKDDWVLVSRRSRRKALSGDNENKDFKEEEHLHIFVHTPIKTRPLQVRLSDKMNDVNQVIQSRMQ